jgi:hypothetical protein
MQEGFIESRDGDALVDDPDRIEGYRAVGLVDGFIKSSETEQMKAWTYLVESGKAWELKGWFASRAIELLAAGEIKVNRQRLPRWVRDELARQRRRSASSVK